MENQSTSKVLKYCDPGFIDYDKAWRLQKAIFDKRLKGEIDDVLLLLEHPNTYTLGKTAKREHLVGSEEYLKENNFSIYDIDRGGDITYHGPGQIVGYPIIDLNNWKKDTHLYLRSLEETIMLTCKDYGLDTERNEKYTGVWIKDRKIAAIGIKVSRWITMHGFAFNINTDLSHFNGIIPCGIRDKDVTSLKREFNKPFEISEVKILLVKHFGEIFRYDEVTRIEAEELLRFVE
jgi:lipoyl(octanoyl) transferase